MDCSHVAKTGDMKLRDTEGKLTMCLLGLPKSHYELISNNFKI